MKRRAIIGPLVLFAVIVACAGCGSAGQTPVAASSVAPSQAPIANVSAQAYVHPLREADLAFKRGGRLAAVLVKEGDQVQAGQTLLKLDDADLAASVAQAEASLARSQAQLAQTKAGPREAQVAQAAANVTRAEAALAAAKAGPTREQIAVAEARVRTLQAQLANSQAGTRAETLKSSEATVLQAEAAVKIAQANYDQVASRPDVGRSAEALALQDATLRLQGARASHEALVRGPTAGDLAILRAQLAEGTAALAQTKTGSTPEQIKQAEATLAEARAQLDLVKAGARTEEVAVSEAAVKEAEAGLAQARSALSDTMLTAPFAGTIGALDLEVGEYVAPGVSLVSLADAGGWRLLTDNLTEKEVVKVTEGQPVNVTVDALPSETLQGTVKRIKPRSETKAGDVTYTVEITLANPSPKLRWGMTASVVFGDK